MHAARLRRKHAWQPKSHQAASANGEGRHMNTSDPENDGPLAKVEYSMFPGGCYKPLTLPIEKSIATSGPFRFLVGPEKKEYMMHAELVASMSKPLRALVTGGMDESRRGVVEWPEVDEATFVRFFQFGYTGQFDAEEPEQPPPKAPEASVSPEPEPAPEVPSSEEPIYYPPEMDHDYIKRVHVKKGRKKRVEQKAKPWDTFRDLYPPLEPKPREWPLPNQDPAYDFTRVFLTYARLYVLADQKDIQGLADLSLRRLHHTLMHLNLREQGADSIAALAGYCFANTCDKGAEQDGLRRLVCFFSACKLEILWTSTNFQRVFGDIGDFSTGVVGIINALINTCLTQGTRWNVSAISN
ncbi:BTB/POZ-like protein [Apiospora phragmitis]|uniref:BTB/POZ-like protein n=1 Tax=Apiospora phragmitis TaxID=2905665 RepID=A0ABR1VQV0_9PEZI